MNAPPPALDVGFKEWRGVCEALALGRQTLILRKGGIAEDGGVFTPEHRVFWLYPTRLHESQQGLGEDPTAVAAPVDSLIVPIRSLAVVEAVHPIAREDDVDRLRPFHIWTDETVHKRFHYRRPGLWALVARVWNRARAESIHATDEQLGCKSWVRLETPISTVDTTPALNDDAWREARVRLLAAIGSHHGEGTLE